VVDEFGVGYDRYRQAITFPVYDEKERLVMITARSVHSKNFWIEEDKIKPVYLLFDLIKKGCTKAFICESQINALYLRSVLNLPSVALFGTGTERSAGTGLLSVLPETCCSDGCKSTGRYAVLWPS
jgi:hypothetical protein